MRSGAAGRRRRRRRSALARGAIGRRGGDIVELDRGEVDLVHAGVDAADQLRRPAQQQMPSVAAGVLFRDQSVAVPVVDALLLRGAGRVEGFGKVLAVEVLRVSDAGVVETAFGGG